VLNVSYKDWLTLNLYQNNSSSSSQR